MFPLPTVIPMVAHSGLLSAVALTLLAAVACGQVLTDGLVRDREWYYSQSLSFFDA